MSWAKLDDQFFRNPKVIAAGRDARDLYMAGLCYCAGGLTDGLVCAGVLPILAAEAGVTRPLVLARRLVEVGLWEECEGGYAVHQYGDYNPSAEQVKQEREAARLRMQKSRTPPDPPPNNGHRSPEVRQNNTGTSAEVVPNVSRSSGPPSPSPYPYPLDDLDLGDRLESVIAHPTPPAPLPAAPAGRTRGTTVPVPFVVTPDLEAWAAAHVPEVDIGWQTEAFCDYWAGRAHEARGRRTDWDGSWRNWMRKAATDHHTNGGQNGQARPTASSEERRKLADALRYITS